MSIWYRNTVNECLGHCAFTTQLFQLDKAGTYNLLMSGEGFSDESGRYHRADLPPDWHVEIVREDTGSEVPVRLVDREIIYSSDTCSATVIRDFRIGQPGTYRLGVWGRSKADVAVVVAPEMGVARVVAFVTGTLTIVMALLASLAIFITVPLLRARNKKRLVAAAP